MDNQTMDVREIIRRTRHKSELPLRRAAYVLTGLGLLTVLVNMFTPSSNPFDGYYGELGLGEIYEIIDVFTSITELSGVIFAIIVLMATIIYTYSVFITGSVRVTEKNFPEIYEKTMEYARVLGLNDVPEVYITQNNGVLNALSSWVMGRHYIVLYSDLVDVAYMENKDFDAVYYVLAHEMGHIYFQHTDLWYMLATYYGRLIPLFSQALSRACEYSCDRLAQALTNNSGSVDCMMVLTAGRHLYKYVDIDDFKESVSRKYRWYEKVGIWFINALSSHPIPMYRVTALLDPYRKSGKLF